VLDRLASQYIAATALSDKSKRIGPGPPLPAPAVMVFGDVSSVAQDPLVATANSTQLAAIRK
jgi:hypothetical protein